MTRYKPIFVHLFYRNCAHLTSVKNETNRQPAIIRVKCKCKQVTLCFLRITSRCRNRRIRVSILPRGPREEEKLYARGPRTLATGKPEPAREWARIHLSPGEDPRGCRSTSLTPRILRPRARSRPGGWLAKPVGLLFSPTRPSAPTTAVE